MIDDKQLAYSLTERFGLEVIARSEKSSEGLLVAIVPAEIERTIAFRIELILGWRSITANFIPGNYAYDLIKKMNESSVEQRVAFSVFAGALKGKGAIVSTEFDGKAFDPENYKEWPGEWNHILISMKKIGVVLENHGDYDFEAAFPLLTGFFGLALALLPLEPVYTFENGVSVKVAEEGQVYFEKIKKYERSHINRAACIEINGDKCKVCGFDFGLLYGELGKGFIHVHHIVPVSQMGGSYILNPGSDLIPVCPNCHAMIHRLASPSDIDRLKRIINSTR